MHYCYLLLVVTFTLLLTGCDGEIAEGMQSEDAKTGSSILADAMMEGMANESTASEPRPPLDPPQLLDGDLCEQIPHAVIQILVPGYGGEVQSRRELQEGRLKSHVVHTCTFLAYEELQGMQIPSGVATVMVFYHDRPTPAVQDYEAQYYTRSDLAGTDGLYMNKDKSMAVTASGNYVINVSSHMTNGELGWKKSGQAELEHFLKKLMAFLPA